MHLLSSPVGRQVVQLLKTKDAGALGLTYVAMLSYIELVKVLAARQVLPSKDARKLMHIGCGLVFMLCWPLFSTSPQAASYAAIGPASITLFFSLVGLGVIKDPSTVKSMSRTGNRLELLRGPLAYGVVLTAATLLFWRQLSAVIPITVLCAGDGFADVFGRRFGDNNRIPWCPRKSWAGTAGFILASSATALVYARLFTSLGWLPGLTYQELLLRTVGAAVVGGLVETLPIQDWDNLTVFVSACVADRLIVTNSHFFHKKMA